MGIPLNDEWFWVSCTWATCGVAVRDGLIIWAPSIWRKFTGQQYDDLIRWLRNTGSPVYTERLM